MSHLHHKVSALIDGELQGAARRRALAHARACELCQRELEQTYALKQRLLGLAAAEPPADLFAALGSVRTEPRDQPAATSRTVVVRRALAGAGGLSVALVTLAYAVGGGGEPPGAPVSPPVSEFSAEFAGSTGLEPLSDPAVEALSSTAAGRRTSPVGAAIAEPVSAPSTGVAGDDPRAVGWLDRAAGAPSSIAFAGVRHVAWVGANGESSMTLAVRHTPRQGTSFAVIDGEGAGDGTTATFVARGETSSTGALGGEPVDLLVDAYDISLAGHGTIDGRSATVVVAARDGQPTARFWIDDTTGLLLRRELYDGDHLVRVSQLSGLHTTGSGFMKHLPPELEAPAGTRLSTQFASSLTDDGWACPPKLPHDYHLTLLHRLQGSHDVMHAAYSDGLSTVSVFEERGVLDSDALHAYDQVTASDSTVWVREGLPTIVIWQAEGTVYTLVTDATPSATAELVASLPHQSDDELDSSRLGRGLAKIGSSMVPGD